jgi:Tfp pilus assembly protein FimV
MRVLRRLAFARKCAHSVYTHQINIIIQAVSAKEASDALVSKLQQQLQAASAQSTAASATSAKLEQQILGDADGGHHHSASFAASLSEADAALAGLWGGGGIVAGTRAWGGADVDKQLREVKNRVQVLQMELVDARLQLERCAENEGRLNAQLQRLLSENDTALVMLGQVCPISVV